MPQINATAPSRRNFLAAIEHLPAGGVLSFEDVTWQEYEALLEDLGDDGHVSVTFDEGKLEIMSPSDWHDYYSRLLAALIEVLAEELEQDFVAFGSMTMKQVETQKGAEPDECFYLTNADKVIGQPGVDLKTMPPPDLAIEIDVMHQSLSKLPIYAALGVPEVWRLRKGEMYFYRLSAGRYTEIATSGIFPFLTPAVLAEFVKQDYIESLTKLKRQFRQWVQAHKTTEAE